MKTTLESKEPPPPGSKSRTVRERSVAHLESILRNAVKLGAGIALVCGVVTPGCKVHVVDPPPPPPPGACEDPDLLLRHECIGANAQWEKAGRKWTIVLNVGLAWRAVGASFEGTQREDLQVEGATVKDLSASPQKLNVTLTPIRGKNQVELVFPMRITTKRMPLHLKLDLSKTRKKYGYIPVELMK